MGEALIVWTIRLSMLCFFASLIAWSGPFDTRRFERPMRVVWTIGFVLLVFHVASAFHFHHNWSHLRALEETARETRQMIGFDFGSGVYFNYLFTVIWGFDVAGMWMIPLALERRLSQIRLVWMTYLMFIAFCGTAVFETGWMRAFGISALVILIVGVADKNRISTRRV